MSIYDNYIDFLVLVHRHYTNSPPYLTLYPFITNLDCIVSTKMGSHDGLYEFLNPVDGLYYFAGPDDGPYVPMSPDDGLYKLVTDPSHLPSPQQERKKPGHSIRTVAFPDSEMGGSAFTSDPYLLNTPRMPPAIYRQVKALCHSRLRELYLCVASPIEGPGKEDHGDIDILVCLERQAIFPSDEASQGLQSPNVEAGNSPLGSQERMKLRNWKSPKPIGPEALMTIAAALGAEHAIYSPNHCSANMAIPWPAADDDSQGKVDLAGSANTRRHIQVDIHIATSLQDLHWCLFHEAHGDFWQLIGSTISPLGLTVDHQAIWVRIPEMEASDRKKSKIFLTSDPAEVLAFLGLSAYGTASAKDDLGFGPSNDIADDDTGNPSYRGIWERPFGSIDDLFAYVASSRWFWVNPAKSVKEEVAKLNHSGRRRLKHRLVYRKWVEEYLPSLGDSVMDGAFPHLRFSLLDPLERHREIVAAAFDRWPKAGFEYHTRRAAFLGQVALEKQNAEIVQYIDRVVEEQHQKVHWNQSAKSALKKIIFNGDKSFGGITPARPLTEESGLYDERLVQDFILDQCWIVGEAACKLNHERLLDKIRQMERRAAADKASIQTGQTDVNVTTSKTPQGTLAPALEQDEQGPGPSPRDELESTSEPISEPICFGDAVSAVTDLSKAER